MITARSFTISLELEDTEDSLYSRGKSPSYRKESPRNRGGSTGNCHTAGKFHRGKATVRRANSVATALNTIFARWIKKLMQLIFRCNYLSIGTIFEPPIYLTEEPFQLTSFCPKLLPGKDAFWQGAENSSP